MKRNSTTCLNTLNAFLLSAALATLVGCGKKTDQDPAASAQKQEELAQNAPRQFTSDELMQKALEAYHYLLDNQDYVQQAGDVKNAMAMAGQTDLRQTLQKPPTQDIGDIISKETQKAKDQIKAEQKIIPMDDIRHMVRKQHPRIKVMDRIRLPSIKGRMVTGLVAAITKNYIKVGATKIIRDDLPFEYRARIWPEEHEQLVEKTIRDQQSRTRWALNKFLQPKLLKALPPKLIQAGYLPNPRNAEASLNSLNTAHWLPRNRILPLLASEIKEGQQAKIDQYWTKLGYVKAEGKDGTTWVPAPPKKKK